MIEQINSLISKEANLNVNYGDYRQHMVSVQSAGYELLSKLDQGKANTNEFKKKMNDFLELLRTESRIPKFVEVTRDVEVVKEKTRPVLVSVFNPAREKFSISSLLNYWKESKD